MSPFLLLKIELVMTCLPTETGSLWKSRNIIDLKIVSLYFTWKTYMTVFIMYESFIFSQKEFFWCSEGFQLKNTQTSREKSKYLLLKLSQRIWLGLDYKMCSLQYFYRIAIILPMTYRTPKDSAGFLEVKDVIECPHIMDKRRMGSA